MVCRKLVIVGVMVTAGVAGLPGLAQAAPAKAPVLQVRTTSSITLADAGGTETTVESLSLPRGSWTVASNVTAINFGAGDYVRCRLQEAGTVFDGGQTAYLADRVSGLANVGVIVLKSAATVVVACDHDAAATSAGQFYIDPGATLTAVEGGPIDGPGAPPTHKVAVVESRTTSSTTLNPDYLAVTSVRLPKGTWAITADVSAVNFSAVDFAACYVAATGGTVGNDGFTQAGVGSSDDYVTGLDLEAAVTVTGRSGTATLLCSSDFSDDIYIDAGATVTATTVAAAGVLSTDLEQTSLRNAAGSSATVSTMKVPAGAWRVRSSVPIGDQAPNNGIEPAQDFLRCTLRANGKAIDGGATEYVTTDSYMQDVVNAGSYTATAPWTLTVVCSHDAANTTGGKWTTEGGAVQAVNEGPIN
jgi:hypothetical protein